MTHEEYQNSIEKIANRYGYEAQSRQLIEEMAELIQSINKFWRKHREFLSAVNPPPPKQPLFINEHHAVIEEIADVEIMLSQIKYLMSCHDEVEQEKASKIERQLQRMESEDKNAET